MACETAIAKTGLRARKTLPKQTLAFLPWSVNERSVDYWPQGRVRQDAVNITAWSDIFVSPLDELL